MNGIYDLRIDLDRLKHFEEKQDDYVDMNAGGTPHTNEEIERIKKMIENL